MKKNILKCSLFALGFLAVALVATTEPAFAQLPQFGSIEGKLAQQVSPLISLIRTVLAVVAALLGLVEAFKASKGGGQWAKAGILLLIASLLLVPGEILRLFGLNDLATTLEAWGF